MRTVCKRSSFSSTLNLLKTGIRYVALLNVAKSKAKIRNLAPLHLGGVFKKHPAK